MKKFLSVLFVSLMAVTVLFANGSPEAAAPAESAVAVNPTGFPIVNEPLTLTVFGIRDNNQCPWKDMLIFKEYEKMTGIHMDFQETGDQGKDEKKSLLFASNELPDVFLRPMFKENELTRYGVESGQLMPLNDLIVKYCPNLKALLDRDPQYWKAIESADGNIYCLPQVNINEIGPISWKQWINKEWLAALDLEVPTTTEELRDVLRAFRDGDPNGNGIKDEIPLGVRESSSIYEVLIGSWGLHRYMNNTINIVDGKVDFWIDSPEFKDYLMYFNSLYEEGLLWVDYYKRDLPLWRSNLSNALFGAFWMPFSDVFLKVEDKFIGFEPLTGPYGDKIWASTSLPINCWTFALSNTCKNPEAAMRWVDYFYSEEGSIFFRMGVQGKTWEYDENGVPDMLDSVKNDERGFMTALGDICLVPGGNNPCVITDNTDTAVATPHCKEVARLLVPYLDDIVFPPHFTEEESEDMVTITQDLYKYRDESVTKFILGEWSFDKWDEYCDTLHKIGLDKLEAIYQAGYDRMH